MDEIMVRCCPNPECGLVTGLFKARGMNNRCMHCGTPMPIIVPPDEAQQAASSGEEAK